ncbi:olfactory receptor 7E178-like [Ochotona princeps]|uniref:olfactory receptor 7E178-like n=1 Tax=Ochotona princeps TaxID=9978 RepID=UPI0027150C1E|nr:olfactory receptor 7E178-like [Ochotona princeps]
MNKHKISERPMTITVAYPKKSNSPLQTQFSEEDIEKMKSPSVHCALPLGFLYRSCADYIETQNHTRVSEFHLMSFSEDPDVQPLLMGLFLSMYLVTVLGNLLIILAVSSDSHLHTPMYFFLCSLSLADMGFISTTVPKMTVAIVTHNMVISYDGCLTQMFMFNLFGCMDDVFLLVMAYDRFVAICHPLHYQVIMNPHRCGYLLLLSFMASLLDSLMQSFVILRVTCFNGVDISNFFCDPSQLLNLNCSDTLSSDIVIYLAGVMYGFLPMSGIFFSYFKIVSSILRVPSPSGRYKAFSTCGSHLTVVCLFYGTGIGVYLSSTFSFSAWKHAVASLVYTVVTPMLNPFVYSLRNGDMKRAMRRLLSSAPVVLVPCCWTARGKGEQI